MDRKVENLLKGLECNPEDFASQTLIEKVQNQLDFNFPSDYIEIISEFNGLEGAIGGNSYLCLFPIQELIETNSDYSLLLNEIPDYFLIGKDAAVTGYAIHKKQLSYHSFGLMSDFETDAIDFCGNSFLEFIEFLYNK